MDRIGVMTGGGDSPAINDCLNAVAREAAVRGMAVLGFRRGWAGVAEGDYVELTPAAVEPHAYTGGTLIHTSRTNLVKIEGGPQKALDNMDRLGVDGLIAIGGDDTLGVAHTLCGMGLRAVGIPQTIDNDIGETDYSIGFDSAVDIAATAMRRLHSTNYSHRTDMLVELMGRDAGWITLYAGLAGGAHYLCVPESPLDLEDLAAHLRKRREAGHPYSMVAVSEGVELKTGKIAGEVDVFGHAKAGGVTFPMMDELRELTGAKPRNMVVGYLQRGGPPSAFDALLAMRMGMAAVDLLADGKFDYMVASRGGDIVPVELERALARNRTVPLELYERAQRLVTVI
ncbi:MAG: ATP-dependent 6-phosphofructokinase [Armatimonadota bacterium]|nr:MAG: ATP-dependent 6-phosphofructokinase [Armatimonadota bacterium]